MAEHKSEQRPRGIYLLPNLLSTAGLFAAFYAIVSGLNGNFESAAIAIFVAMIADLLDGRVARMTNTESEFGAEYDSMCDMVSFGVAPALILYSWVLRDLGKLGWLIAFGYTATTALRLARFNTQIGIANKDFFQGLPSPGAASVVASLVWCCQGMANNSFIIFLSAMIGVMVSVLMVSNIRYYSFKGIDLKGKVPFFAVVFVVMLFTAVSINPPMILLIAALCYATTGPVFTLIFLHRRRRQRRQRSKKKKNES